MTAKLPDIGDIDDFDNVKVKLEPKKGYYDYDHNSFLSGKILKTFFPV